MSLTSPFHYSELQKIRRCPMQHHYAYVREGTGLRKVTEALNLKRGLWLHAMLQADALKRGIFHESLLEVPNFIDVPGVDESVMVKGFSGQLSLYESGIEFELSWKGMLELLTEHSDYAMLPDDVIEEHYTEGGQTLPEACRNIMRGYLWQYRDVLPKRKPLLVEVEWARTNTNGSTPVEHEGRADLVEEDEKGRVLVVDWKSTKGIPGPEFKLMESQRFLYAWGLEHKLAEHDVRIQGLSLDYLVTSTPTKPTQNQPKKAKTRKAKCPDCDGTGDMPIGSEEKGDAGTTNCPACEGEGKRLPDQPTPNELKGELSARVIKTTPLVYFEALKEYGLEITDYHRERLQELEDNNEFYQRFTMPMNQKVLLQILRESAQAAEDGQKFRDAPGLAYRNVDRSCKYACDFLPLCMAELYGQDAQLVRDRDYVARKPLEEEE